MKSCKDVIDWPAELRAFVEERVPRAERSLVIRRILERMSSISRFEVLARFLLTFYPCSLCRLA